MNVFSLRDAANSGRPMIGSWLNFGHTSNAEILAASGFEFVCLDLEHSVIDLYQMQNLIMAIESRGAAPMVRLTSNDPDQAKRAMDAGTRGVIFPMINSAEEARKAVSSVKFPPVGTRSVGIGRAHTYGYDFTGHMESSNREVLVIVQIEHKLGVENAEEIFAVEGVDGYMIGPYDLSGSLGIPGQVRHPDMIEAQKKVFAAAKKAGIMPGMFTVYPDPDAFQEYLLEGYRFLVVGSDLIFLSEYTRQCAELSLELRSKMESDASSDPVE